MPHRIKSRRSIAPGDRFKAAWGIRLPGVDPLADEFIVFSFRIGIKGCDTPIRLKGVTHQTVILAIDPETKIDFNPKKSLFEQHGLVFSRLPCIAYQTKYASDDDCLKRVSACVQHITDLDVPPPSAIMSEEEWDRMIKAARASKTEPLPYVILPRKTFATDMSDDDGDFELDSQ